MVMTVRISNKSGLHARSAATFVQLATKFKSDVKVKKEEVEVNGKSILGMMMLGAIYGSKIILKITGPDEKRALEELSELIKNKFGEE
jgi:phosphocarrier protein HPr